MHFTIASFDIGKHNFAIYIEKYSIDKLNEIKENKQKYTRKECIEQVCMLGRMKLFKCVSLIYDEPIETYLTTKQKGKTYLSHLHFKNMYKFLDTIEYLKKVDQVIIEEQVKYNKDCIKLAQHCYSYFMMKYPKVLVEYVPAEYKTTKLGVPTQRTTKYLKVEDTDFSIITLRAFPLGKLRDYVKKNAIKIEYKKYTGKGKYLRNAIKMQLIKAIQKFNNISDTKGGIEKSIKTWSIDHARKIFELRKDKKALEIMKMYKSKCDDISDTFNQCQGFKMCIVDN